MLCYAIIGFVIMFICIGAVAKRKTAGTAIWCGGILAVLALAASLFAPLFLPAGTDPAQVQYVVNSLLVVAAIGANLLAGGVTAGIKA